MERVFSEFTNRIPQAITILVYAYGLFLVAGLLPPVWDFFIHANVSFDALRWFLPVLSTPQFHWIHHSKLPEHQDKNYATFRN